MKKIVVLFVTIILLPIWAFSQSIENVDYISPFNDGLAAIKKGNQWAFINTEGNIVIDFRDDIKVSKIGNDTYPIFKNNRCLILQEKEGITYFGYMDKSGSIVIKPQFLNATNFNNNAAIALKLVKENLGNNDLLGKPIVSFKYAEVVINTKGKVIHYLSDFNHITLSKDYIKESPKIRSKLISDSAFAIWSKDKKWVIKNLNEQNELK